MGEVYPIKNLDDIRTIKKYLKPNPMHYALFVTGINTGLRIGDILNLKVSDVWDYHSQTVKTTVDIIEHKTSKKKQFQLNLSARDALEEYIVGKTKKSRGAFKQSDRLFHSQYKRPLCRSQAFRIIKGACDKAGIEHPVGTHTMRKTFGYHLFKAGVSIEIIQKIFNHSSSSVTLGYIGITQDVINSVYQGILL